MSHNRKYNPILFCHINLSSFIISRKETFSVY